MRAPYGPQLRISTSPNDGSVRQSFLSFRTVCIPILCYCCRFPREGIAVRFAGSIHRDFSRDVIYVYGGAV